MKKHMCQNLLIYLILLILSVLISGCVYKSYAGRYWIGKASPSFIAQPASPVINDKIEEVVRGVAKDFGFVEDKRLSWMEENVITFGGKRSDIKTSYDNLNGSNSTIMLLITKGPQPEVGIKDYKYSIETEFIKALKKELELRLSTVVDMNGVVFTRHWDLMD
jgi:hypothetical protein